MIQYYALKYQSYDTYTTPYMESLSGERVEEYYKVVYDEI